MPRRFQVRIEVNGLRVPVRDGEPLAGFFTDRRVLADDAGEAKDRAVEALKLEPKIKWLLETTERETGQEEGYVISATHVCEISWWRWRFGKFMKGLVLWSEDVSRQREHEAVSQPDT